MRRRKAVLVIAKLDRLARDVAFVSSLLDGKIEFVACDTPHASRMMLQILSVFAEHEARMISERTKAALAAAKARGVVLGSYGRELADRQKRQAKPSGDHCSRTTMRWRKMAELRRKVWLSGGALREGIRNDIYGSCILRRRQFWRAKTSISLILDRAYEHEDDGIIVWVGYDSFKEWLLQLRIGRREAKGIYRPGMLCRWWADEMVPSRDRSSAYAACLMRLERQRTI